jgi:hypothetical protein
MHPFTNAKGARDHVQKQLAARPCGSSNNIFTDGRGTFERYAIDTYIGINAICTINASTVFPNLCRYIQKIVFLHLKVFCPRKIHCFLRCTSCTAGKSQICATRTSGNRICHGESSI